MMRKKLSVCIILLFIGIAVSPSIYANTGNVSLEPVVDLECYGALAFYDVELGDVLVSTITIGNIGDIGSLLSWEIESYPEWGCWTFNPESGEYLLAGETEDIVVEIIVPDYQPPGVWDYYGEIVFINSENPEDFCTIHVYLFPKSVPVIKNTPIQLVFLLINRLCNYKDMQDIESEDDVLQIIESDAELNEIIEKLKSFDCGCEDDSSEFRWSFPIICLILCPLEMIFLLFYMKLHIDLPYLIIETIGSKLNCFWT